MIKFAGKARRILFKAIPFVLAVIILKLIFHKMGIELISLNAMFSGIIGATVFLMGFLLSGVLSDYKESEKIPGELAASLVALADELETIHKSGKCAKSGEAMAHLCDFTMLVRDWLFKKVKSREVMTRLRGFNDFFLAFDTSSVPVNYIARLKQEQSGIRKILIRIHTIRETDFISSGYLIASTSSGLLLTGLVLSKIEPFYESLFFVGVIAYLLVFLLFLIRDLDNPFGYYEGGSSEDVSLKPLEDAISEMEIRRKDLSL